MTTLCAHYEHEQHQRQAFVYRRRLSAAVRQQCDTVLQLVWAQAPPAQVEDALQVLSELTGQPRYQQEKKRLSDDPPFLCILCRQPTALVPGGLCEACKASLAP